MGYKFRTVMVTALATCVVGAVGVASASAALPELVNKEGNQLVKTHFTATGGDSVIEMKRIGALICRESHVSGEVTGLKTAHAILSFTKCTGEPQESCETPKAKQGEIALGEISAKLVLQVEPKGKIRPALLLPLPSEITLECPITGKIKVKGSLLMALHPSSKPSTVLNMVGIQSEGEEAAVEYEETEGGELKPAELLAAGEGLTNLQTGIETELGLTFEEEVTLT
jgi:hypothetical protein